jgi:hypothetical protein
MGQKKPLPGKQKAKPASKKTTKQKPGKTLLGDPADQVVINPEDKRLNERVVSMTNRMHRAVSARKNKARLERARKIARKRLAKGPSLNRRAMKRAKNILRTRYAGQAGKEYTSLSMSQKIAIDKMVDRRKGAIKKIATKIAPRVKSDEMRRLQSVGSGKQFRTSRVVVSSFEMIGAMLSEKENKAIMEKAEASGVDYQTLLAVFNRGKTAYKKTTPPGKTPSQYAFERLNSYINGGKAFKEDVDLREEKKTLSAILSRGMHTPRNMGSVNPEHIAPVHTSGMQASMKKSGQGDDEITRKRKHADIIRRKTQEYVKKVVESTGSASSESPSLAACVATMNNNKKGI